MPYIGLLFLIAHCYLQRGVGARLRVLADAVVGHSAIRVILRGSVRRETRADNSRVKVAQRSSDLAALIQRCVSVDQALTAVGVAAIGVRDVTAPELCDFHHGLLRADACATHNSEHIIGTAAITCAA